jgi:hypothetical protein
MGGLNQFFKELEPFANEDLFFRMRNNPEAGAPKHGLDPSSVGDPPIGGIASVTIFNKIHEWEAFFFKQIGFPKIIIFAQWKNFLGPSLHRLESQ